MTQRIIRLVLNRYKPQFFRRKLAKVAKNSDHNIGPQAELPDFSWCNFQYEG
jgi:hypothetical protein